MVAGFGMAEIRFGPSDYGMGTDLKGRDSIALYLSHIPVVAEAQTFCLFGFVVKQPFRRQMKKEGIAVMMEDPTHGQLLFQPGHVSAPPRIPFTYLDLGWHPLCGPIILRTLYREGDNLLLGKHFFTWAMGIKDIVPSSLPTHWLSEAGGTGAGMLVRMGRDKVEEWIFMLVHNNTRLIEQVNALFRDINGLLEAKLRDGTAPPRIRFLITHNGFWEKPSRAETRKKLHTYREAFRHGVLIVDTAGQTYIPLGEVQVGFGVVAGVRSLDPKHWHIWDDEEGSQRVSPKAAKFRFGGLSRSPRKRIQVRDKLQNIITSHSKLNENNKTERKDSQNPPKTPQTPRLFDG